jgi:hypothetical protein
MIHDMLRRRLWKLIRTSLMLAAVVLIVAPDWPAFGDWAFQFDTIVGRDRRFNFIAWTIDAFGKKAQAILSGTHHFLPADVESEFVRAYLDKTLQAKALDAEIERIYIDPSVTDAQAASAQLVARRADIRAEMNWRQPLAEAIVQQQVAFLLAEEGLEFGGTAWPPVMMTMSPVPSMVVVSPRDRITMIDSATLVPGVSTADKEEMESAIYEELDRSALVVPIGGIGTYPAMISETGSINWLAEVVVHEWTHHWLSLHPLGVRYLESPEMRTINETVASIVDLEIGPKVIERFYPEMVPQPVLPAPDPDAGAQPPAFDFGAEMAETRTIVDSLLAEGKVEAAEAYMEQRRQFFVNNGYMIRKLNQAYFAFYGGYAAEPGGAAGGDPIGPMLRALRAASPSLHAFLLDVGRVTSLADLESLYQAKVGDVPAVQ